MGEDCTGGTLPVGHAYLGMSHVEAFLVTTCAVCDGYAWGTATGLELPVGLASDGPGGG